MSISLTEYIKSLLSQNITELTLNNATASTYAVDKNLTVSDIEKPFTLRLSGINPDRNKKIVEAVQIINCVKFSLEIGSMSKIPGVDITNSSLKKLDIHDSEIGINGIHCVAEPPIDNKEENFIEIGEFSARRVFFRGLQSWGSFKINFFEIQECRYVLEQVHSKAETNFTFSFENCKIGQLSSFNRKSDLSGFVFSNSQIQSIKFGDPKNSAYSLNQLSFIENCQVTNIVIRNTGLRNFESSNSAFKSLQLIYDENAAVTDANISLIRSSFESLLISGHTNIATLKFENIKISEGRIENSLLHGLSFSRSFLNDSVLYIYDCICGGISFINFYNFGKITLKSLRPVESDQKQVLHVETSDLGKIQIINCNMKEKWSYFFNSSNILGAFIVSSYLPQQMGPNTPRLRNETRELFSQLYKVYEGNGNRVRALLYKSLSLQGYLEELQQKEKKSFREYLDLISLFLNNISNRFNYNLGWSILALIISTLLLFLVFNLSLGYSLSFSAPGAFARFAHVVSYSFEFISPVRKTIFMDPFPGDPPLYATPGTRVIDGISRIIIAYLIYQFIQAFRKFGKE